MSHNKISPLKGIAIVLLTIAMPFTFLASCMKEKKEVIEIGFNPETSYTTKTTNFTNQMSDSGIVKAKMTSALRLIFNKASDPFWVFPEGAYVEQYDTLFNVIATIKADTAYRYVRRNIWELKGNVDITTSKGEHIQTEQIFWDQNKATIYSDCHTISTGDDGKRVEGTGFTSDQQMNDINIFNSKGGMPFEENQRKTNDTIPANNDNIEVTPLHPN